MSRKAYTRILLLAVILIAFSAFYSLPYYVTKPGMAKELEPIVNVEGGDEADGSFMLTTVRMGKANIYSYLIAHYSKYQVLYKEEDIRGENETDEEYNNVQLHLMDSSKNNAIKTAYEKAGKPFSFDYLGVYVMGVTEGMPAEGKLKPGDQILKLDGKSFESSKRFIEYVGGKQEGDQVKVTYQREGKKKNIWLKVKRFEKEPDKIGIGIYLDDYKKPVTEPEVSIDTDQIGGPSAGLMFTLEIYNQLTEGDLTKGRKIAGTGTMSEDGTVGPIGGIQQKIVAASDSGAEIFFAPNEGGAKKSNYRDALKAAKDIKTKMKIIPVDSFDDALAYLEKLPE